MIPMPETRANIPGKLFVRNQPKTPDDRVVISGISGTFPSARDMNILSHNLYNKIDMVNDHHARWKHLHAKIPNRMGTIEGLEKFDANFFGVHFMSAESMDPQGRLLLEKAYEAVLDSGVNPKSLCGSRTAVFVGICSTESDKTCTSGESSPPGARLKGCSRSLLANRISFSMGLTGPSCCLDTACSSSLYALDFALTALSSGECDSALVGGANLLLDPYITLLFARMGALSANGFCRPFDVDASGYCRSEAVCVLFLQKAKNAKRIYGDVLYSKTNSDGQKAEGMSYPSKIMQEQLLTEFYDDVGVNPIELAYVEAHGTGTVVGDPVECSALDSVLCKHRTEPLLVGSIKSNIGHTEASSGICGIAKIILAFETGNIAPNINFTRNRPDIPSLVEGRLKVVTDVIKLQGSMACVNSFGIGGANAHALFKRNPIEKENNGAPNNSLPRLVCWAGRTDESINIILDALESQPLDLEFVGLLHNIQSIETKGYMYRGYGLYNHTPGENANCLARDSQEYSGLKRPIVWIFSGMGSQWPGMASSLMEIGLFRDTIQKCHNVLVPYGLNLINILTSPDANILDNILHSFVGITAIQAAIVDLLRVLGMEADFYIGHSLGEIGCAYADGCFTLEETVLSAYSRGMASIETKTIWGAMAAIGLGYKEIKNILPPSIECACHNGPDSSTISGPEEEVAKFVDELKQKGIFAKEVSVSNIAYHSRYVADIGSNLLKRLREVHSEPKKRSPKWLSTSVPKNLWDEDTSQYSSAEYHTNNLLNSVLFEETSSLLPTDAVTIEIAPHGLLQAILKKSMPKALHIPLCQRGNKHNVAFFLGALGKLFLAGLNVPIERIYPEIKFPVSRGTPMIAPLIRWDHSEDWFVTNYESQTKMGSAERKVKIGLTDPDYDFIAGHTIDGLILFPAMGYLQLAWETLAMMKGQLFFDVNVEFDDIRFLRPTAISKEYVVELTIVIHPGSGQFEITENNSAVVSGVIKEILKPIPLTVLPPLNKSDTSTIVEHDFYKELRLRGYHYNGAFRAVQEARCDGMYGKVKWNLNWIAFMDCILQIGILSMDFRSLVLPTRVQKIIINAKEHMALTANLDPENPCFEVFMCDELKTLRSGGIEIVSIAASAVPRRKVKHIPVLESYQFIPNLPAPKLFKSDVARICAQIGFENNRILKVKVVEVAVDCNEPLINYFGIALNDLPLIAADLILLTTQDISLEYVHVEDEKLSTQSNCMYIIGYKSLECPDFIEQCYTSLNENGYIIIRESPNLNIESITLPNEFQLIGVYPTEDETIVMLQRMKKLLTVLPQVIQIDQNYDWMEQSKNAIKDHAITLVARNELSGIIGLVNCLREELDVNQLSCVFIDDKNAPAFDLEHPLYKNQLQLGLAINVYRNGQWGTYRHLKLKQDIKEVSRSDHCFANVLQVGDLSTLTWMQGPLNAIINKNVINIQYSSVNFRDVMLATGRLSNEKIHTDRLVEDCILGFEYAGVNQRGERVMGVVGSGSMATQIIPDSNHLVWKVPEKWTLQEAATCPVVYLTVYIAFFLENPIKAGKSILIHAGSGGIGMAAIRIATTYGLTVYTTVSTQQKKVFLLETFPELKECNIGNSRDCSFEKMIKLQTKGAGVDFVLNSLADDKLHASIRCLGHGGTFLEIGKFDILNNTKIGLECFSKGLTFRSVLLDIALKVGDTELKRFHDLLEKGLATGIIKPLHCTVFEVYELEKAYRYLSTGKHVGKVLVRIRDDEYSEASVPIKAIPRVYCNSDLVYIIPGGLGGFGLELADWLVIRGARKLVLSSTRGISNSYQSFRIKIWESYGTKVLITTADISKSTGCEQLFHESLALGQIGGIFNLAVSLRDAIFENQTVEKFVECMAPKAIATKHLDDLSRKMCPQLKYFVVFSSFSCGRGNAGQSNYGMANSIMERIIEQRAAHQLPAKAIQWGPIDEVGIVADILEGKSNMVLAGMLQQRISSCLQELDVLLMTPNPIVASMVVADKRSSGAKYNLIESVLNIMGIRNIKSISMLSTLSDVGMDSLMAVEIKQTLEREFEIFLTPQDLRELTFSKLQEWTDDRKKVGVNNVKSKSGSENNVIGLNLFSQNLGDEATINENVVRLITLNNSEDYSKCVLIVPGIEGIVGPSWTNLAIGIHQPAFVLQLTDTIDKTSIPNIAEAVADAAIEVFRKQKFFYIIGYSFGALVTLELARIFEKAGMQGYILLIDGAPQFSKKLTVSAGIDGKSDHLIQIMLLGMFIQNVYTKEYTHLNLDEIYLKLNKCETWDDKVSYLLDFGKTHTDYSDAYIRKISLAIYNRFKISIQMDTENIVKIKTPIILVRPTVVAVTNIEEDYELCRYTEGVVNVRFIEGNHQTMLQNPKLVQIINECDPNVEQDHNLMENIG